MASFTVDVENSFDEKSKMGDELHFQDIPHSDDKGNTQTHTFTNFPHSANSDDEAGDKEELLKDEKKPPSFWTFEYYQQFFDVDTRQVLFRILGSMTPRPGRNYLTSQIRPNPDLYGPFWICTTLVFTTAIAGNLANYLQVAGKGYVWKYDFHKVTFAATAIFSYWWLIPSCVFGVLWWRGSQARYTFLEIISVYGYSLAIYVPISVLWAIQINWLQWILVIIGAALSGSVLFFTFWPAVREDSKQVAVILIAVILIFHAALAAGFVLYFFHVPSHTTAPANGTVPLVTTPVPPANKSSSKPVKHSIDTHPASSDSSKQKLTVKSGTETMKTGTTSKKGQDTSADNKNPRTEKSTKTQGATSEKSQNLISETHHQHKAVKRKLSKKT